MKAETNKTTMWQNLLKEGWGDLSLKNPTVLSCGGIYIPRRRSNEATSYHMISTPMGSMPVKIIVSSPPMNILKIVMAKETMN